MQGRTFALAGLQRNLERLAIRVHDVDRDEALLLISHATQSVLQPLVECGPAVAKTSDAGSPRVARVDGADDRLQPQDFERVGD